MTLIVNALAALTLVAPFVLIGGIIYFFIKKKIGKPVKIFFSVYIGLFALGLCTTFYAAFFSPHSSASNSTSVSDNASNSVSFDCSSKNSESISTKTTSETENESTSSLSEFFNAISEFDYTEQQLSDMEEILENVGIYQIIDIDDVKDNGTGIQTVSGYAFRDTSFGDRKDVVVQVNIENGTIYYVHIYCPSYYTENQVPYLSGLEDRRAELYYDYNGGYLKRIDWESRSIVAYQ